MSEDQVKADLHTYLKSGHDALVWKLEGLSERDARRPMTRTGTNLLGVVKHVASVEAGYLGEVFGRPFDQPLPWLAPDAEANADMWATAEESREQVLDLAARVWAHCDATVAALPLDAPGVVPWWSAERNAVTLGRVLVHLVAEVHRHAGQVDVVRELLDGSAGHRRDYDNLPPGDEAYWQQYRARLEQVAQQFEG